MAQRILNTDIKRFFLSYTMLKGSRFLDGDSLRQGIIKLLLNNHCSEIKGYTYSCILFTSKKDKDYDFWQRLLFKMFQQDMCFVFGEVAKREVSNGYLEVGRFMSLRHEDKVFAANFDRLVEKVEYELRKGVVK